MRILALALPLALVAGCAGPGSVDTDGGRQAVENGVTLTWTEGNGTALSGELLARNGGTTTWYVVGSSSCTRHLTWRIEGPGGERLDPSQERYEVCTADLATMSFAPGETRKVDVDWDGKAWDEGKTERSPVPAGKYTLVATVSGDDDPPKDHRVDAITVVSLRVPVRVS